jgi:hypothetical protein
MMMNSSKAYLLTMGKAEDIVELFESCELETVEDQNMFYKEWIRH